MFYHPSPKDGFLLKTGDTREHDRSLLLPFSEARVMMIPEVHGRTRIYIVLLSCGVPVRLGGTGTSRRLFMVFFCLSFFFLRTFTRYHWHFFYFCFACILCSCRFCCCDCCCASVQGGRSIPRYSSADCFSGKHLRQEQNIHSPSFLPRRVGLGSRIIQCRIHKVAWMVHMNARIPTYTHIYYIFRFFLSFLARYS